MHISLRHLCTFNLSLIVTSTLFQCGVSTSKACPAQHSGRLPINDCRGYVDCMSGVEIDRAICQASTLYSAKTENCEPKESVGECTVMRVATATTEAPVVIDDGGMWVPDTGSGTSSTFPQIVRDGPDSVAIWSTTTPAKTTTEVPSIANDEGTWIEDNSTPSTPQVVYDGPDAVAPLPSTVSAGTSTTPILVYDGTDATAIWSTTESAEPLSTASEYYTPDRDNGTCIPVDAIEIADKSKNNKRHLRSVWDRYYSTKDACCDLFNFKHYDSCINN